MNFEPPFGEKLGQVQGPIPGERSRKRAEELTAVEAPGVTYQDSEFPVFWKRALGSNVEDVDGNVYVDLTAAFGVTALGHSSLEIRRAIANQMEELGHGMGDVHPPEIKVSILQKLAEIFPRGSAKSFLCNGGSEAVEAALKTAYLKTQKPGILYFEGGYHGLSYGTLPISGRDEFREPFLSQIAQTGFRARFPKAKEEDFQKEIDRSLSELEELRRQAEKKSCPIGALVVEPIQGRGGVNVPPTGWLQAVRTWTKENDIVMIADEIMTGLGRTGRLFAVDHENVVPDLLCLGKSLTGMLPFSACIGTKETMDAWPKSQGEALHTSTFLGHPLGCAAALASIETIQKKNLTRRARELGRDTLYDLRSWAEGSPYVKEVRGSGFMIGLDLEDQDQSKGLGAKLMKDVLKKGVLVLPAGANGNTLSILPPLTIGGRQLEWALQTVFQTLSQW